MNITIENEALLVTIAAKGAELQNIFHKENQLEYLWNGDAAYWSKRSPVLFPVVGSLKKNEYEYGGKKFSLGRHGFARDMEFEPGLKTDSAVVFLLQSTEATLKQYPFSFQFFIQYSLQGNRIFIHYIIEK